ncbi:MAG: hypothetical protein ABSC93_10235 [Bryobacteraceae bacterium]|jgi:hypothetical protein
MRAALGLALLAASAPGLAGAVELQPATVRAWDDYVRSADAGMQARRDGRKPFLWADEAAGRAARLRQGEVLVAPVSGRGTINAPNGLIHDWIGAVFIPHATVEEMLAVVHDYGRYKQFYKPVVADSKALDSKANDERFSMIMQHRALLVSAAMQGQYESRDFALDQQRGYSITAATRIQEIEDYGRSNARLLPPGQGSGFLWRLHSIVRYEERDGGLYLEVEAIALTRDIPFSLRWLVSPVVNRLSVDSLMVSLRQTREAVNSESGARLSARRQAAVRLR